MRILPKELIYMVLEYTDGDVIIDNNKNNNNDLKLSIYEDNLDKLRWPEICKNPAIPLNFLIRYIDKLNWRCLCENSNIPLSFFDFMKEKKSCLGERWYDICFSHKFCSDTIPNFFERNLDMLDKYKSSWYWLCANETISINFIERYVDKLDEDCWRKLFLNPAIPIFFLEHHFERKDGNKKNKKYLANLCRHPGIRVEFIDRNIEMLDEVCWANLCRNKFSGSLDFFKRHVDKFSKYQHCWINLLSHSVVSDRELYSLIKPYTKNLNIEFWRQICRWSNDPVNFLEYCHFTLDMLDETCWHSLCDNANIPLNFLKRHTEKLDKICWEILCENDDLTNRNSKRDIIDFFESNIDQLYKLGDTSWYCLCRNPSIEFTFFENHLDKVEWAALCKNPNIPTSFYERHIDDIDWSSLCENKNVDVEFVVKYKNELTPTCWYCLSGNPGVPKYYVKKWLRDLFIN